MIPEYAHENGAMVGLQPLQSPLLPLEDFTKTHQRTVLFCHDVFIHYGCGILLVQRDNLPVKNVLWPLSGRVQRGKSVQDSLREKVLHESGLFLDPHSLRHLDTARTFFHTDPFGHGHGTDTINAVYYAKTLGHGSLQLDSLHSQPTLVIPDDMTLAPGYRSSLTFQQYTPQFSETLHPYVRDYLAQAMNLLRSCRYA